MSEQLHERLRELLGSAHAESCQVVATFIDIRGFSTFSAQGESFDSALYLRSVFTTILSSHFDDTAFFKPSRPPVGRHPAPGAEAQPARGGPCGLPPGQAFHFTSPPQRSIATVSPPPSDMYIVL
jgi:hypothetical protein